ncbi:hypothetical protein CJU90_3428 [Yarrowia sp. C11]|nr:hypothetical protein CKK34_4875 [Yarrowia sp. E02]KAG5369889.1 hypothetical protein CJU90_3428 [Yarrowia sp. C11]
MDGLVAKYLKDKGYTNTLVAFEKECDIKHEPVTIEELMSYLPKMEKKDDNVVTEKDVTLTVLTTKSKNMIVDTKLINGHVITTDSAKNLTFYDSSLQEIKTLTLPAVGRVIAAGANNTTLVGCMDGSIVQVDSEYKTSSFKPHARFVGGISVSEDGLIASIGFDKKVVVTKQTGFEQMAFIDSLTNPTAVAWTHLGLAVSREDCTSIQLLSDQLEKIKTIPLVDAHYMPHSFTVFDMVYSPQSKEIACLTSHTPYARVIIVKSDESVVSFPTLIPQDKYSLGRLSWLDSKTLAIAGDDGSVRLFNQSDWRKITVADSRLRCISASDGYVATASIDKEVELIEIQSLEDEVAQLKIE